jgi:hypothetical protein
MQRDDRHNIKKIKYHLIIVFETSIGVLYENNAVSVTQRSLTAFAALRN